jgi:hypothetical protein
MLLLFRPGLASLPKALKEYDQNKAKSTRPPFFGRGIRYYRIISSGCALASFLISLRTDCDIAA